MKITVEIPSALRRFTDGVQTIECSSETLPDLLGELPVAVLFSDQARG